MIMPEQQKVDDVIESTSRIDNKTAINVEEESSVSTSVATSQKDENTKLENSTYNILMAMGKEANFLYSTIDTYIQDAERDGREYLVELWNEMKKDKQNHLRMLRQALEKETEEKKLSQ
jgi:hypothetical protein